MPVLERHHCSASQWSQLDELGAGELPAAASREHLGVRRLGTYDDALPALPQQILETQGAPVQSG